MKKLLFGVFLSFNFTFSYTQTFSAAPNDTILDNQSNEYTLQVSGLPSVIDTANFGLESICLNLYHTWMADLSVYLISPDGTSVLLSNGIGGDTDFMTNSCFSAEASNSIAQGNSPFTGTFLPFGQLGLINNQQNPNGTWILRVVDNYGQDAGNLYNFSITFGTNPATIFTIDDSDLPIVMLETNGQEIPNEPKINGTFKIIYNGEGNRNFVDQLSTHFHGNCGLEIRGASSSGFPKKSYDLEIRDSNNQDLDTAILGFPAESDWVLSAQYTDKTLLRNMLSMHLLQTMGRYAPRFRPVELFINNQYQGVYIFMEKVKKGNDRVDIATLNPNEINGDDLTGGYIVKLDKDSGNSNPGWESPFAPIPAGSPIVFEYNYPDGDVIVQQQKDYIEGYVTAFETALDGPNFMNPLSGYRAYVDYNSCLDALLISEATRSIDAYRKSFFVYKDKDSKGGKLVMAPIWDYDLTFGNADFCDGQNTDGWQYNFNYVCGEDYWINPFWFPRMMEDTIFQQDLACRWRILRQGSFHTDTVHAWIDNMAAKLNESQNWNYTIWPTMGSYVWPNSFVGQNYQEEINFMKSWITDRMEWLDTNLPGDTSLCSPLNLNDLEKDLFSVFPNPANDVLYVELKTDLWPEEISLFNISGQKISTIQPENSAKNVQIDLSGMSGGLYFVQVVVGEKTVRQKFTKR